jgi:hypothetical protein
LKYSTGNGFSNGFERVAMRSGGGGRRIEGTYRAPCKAVDIGEQFAYKVSVAPERGNLTQEEKSMPTKKPITRTKHLKKAKKLEATKPLSRANWGGRGTEHPSGGVGPVIIHSVEP